jgi:small subunit ribosomal protein S21
MRQPTVEVKVKRGQNVEKSLRRLKKLMEREGIMQSIQDKRFYKKPSQIKKEARNKKRKRNA